MARWIKTPHWLRNREYTRMPPASRLLFNGLFELLEHGGDLIADIPQLKNWLSLDRDYVRRALPAVIDSGLLICEELTSGEYRFSLTEELLDVVSTSRSRSADAVSTSRQRSASVASTSRSRSASVASTSRSRSVVSNNDAGLEPAKTPLEENRIEENRKEKRRKEEKNAPVGAASAEPPPCVSGSLTLEEAQEIVAHYAEVRPNVIRFKDGRTGEPMTDLVWAATLLWFWDKSRAAQFGIESNPAEAPKEQPKVTIMDTRAAGKAKVERPEDCDEQTWKDWMRVRGRNALTETAWGAFLNEADKAGVSPAEAVRICAERSWRGFRAEWLERDKVVSMRGGRKEYDLNAMKFEPVYTADGEVSTNPADYW